MQSRPQQPARLSTPWIFWEDRWEKPQGASDSQLKQTLTNLGEVDNSKNLWGQFDRFPIQSVNPNCSLHLFRRGVLPEWEDPTNAAGGHFRMMPTVARDIALAAKHTGILWFEIVASAVGDQFACSASVVGVSYTNKPFRNHISVWLRTCDQQIVCAMQRDLVSFTGDKFTIRFLPHQEIAKTDFVAHEPRPHRRTKSAPDGLAPDDSEEEDSTKATLPPPAGSSAAQPHVTVADGEKSPLSGRPRPPALDTKLVPTHTHTDDTEKPAPKATLVVPTDHQRTRSDGYTHDIVPQILQHVETSPAAAASSTTVLLATNSELRESDSGILVPSASQLPPPTPIKDWAMEISPSEQTKKVLSFPPSSQPTPKDFSPPVQTVPQQLPAVSVGAFRPNSRAVTAVPLYQSGAGHMQYPIQVATMPVPQSSQMLAAQQHLFAVAHPTPPPHAAAFRDTSQPKQRSPDHKSSIPVHCKSDAPTFVHNGWQFPAGLNRKERRRIIFSGEVNPSEYPGAVFLGNDVPNTYSKHDNEASPQ